MLYSPDYQITLPAGNISLLFNTWTFRGFCRKKNIEMEELIQSVREGKAFKGNDLPGLLLIAAESFLKFNNQESNYTDLDACIWMDAIGGVNSLELIVLYKHFVGKLLNISMEQFDVIWNKMLQGETEELPVGKEVKKKKHQKS